MSKIIFDEGSKTFSVVESDRSFGINFTQSAALGAITNLGVNHYQKSKMQNQMRAQGKSEEEIKKATKQRFGGYTKQSIKGAGAGVGVRTVGGILGSVGRSTGITEGAKKAYDWIAKRNSVKAVKNAANKL